MAYKIQELVENGFDFSQVYPEKQQAVRESTGLDFDLAGIVKFLQRQTNNFTTENPVAKDLDNAVFVLVQKWQGERGETPEPEPVEDKSAEEEVKKQLEVVEKTEEEKQAEIREAIEVLEMLGDDLDEEQKDALEILKSLLA
jgi:hypothetical protein